MCITEISTYLWQLGLHSLIAQITYPPAGRRRDEIDPSNPQEEVRLHCPTTQTLRGSRTWGKAPDTGNKMIPLVGNVQNQPITDRKISMSTRTWKWSLWGNCP